jgi:hypothetical protein
MTVILKLERCSDELLKTAQRLARRHQINAKCGPDGKLAFSFDGNKLDAALKLDRIFTKRHAPTSMVCGS